MMAGTCVDVGKIANGLRISQSNGTSLQATHRDLLPCTTLPHAVRIAHILPTLQRPLVSITHIFDNGFNITFDAEAVTVLRDATPILTITRSHFNDL